MNPFSVFLAVIFILIPFSLLLIVIDNMLTGVFYTIDGNSFTQVANLLNYILYVIVTLLIALIAVMVMYRKYT